MALLGMSAINVKEVSKVKYISFDLLKSKSPKLWWKFLKQISVFCLPFQIDKYNSQMSLNS